MAFPAYGSVGAYSSTSGVATITPALPASIAANDALIAFIIVNATGKTITVDAAWTIGNSINTGNISAAWAWRKATGTDTAPVFSWTGVAGLGAQVVRYSGVAASFIGVNNSATANTSATLTVGSLTTTADNSTILLLFAAGGASVFALPDGFTARDSHSATNGSDKIQDGLAYKSGTSTTPIALTIAAASWASFGIELLGTGSAPAGEPAARASQSIEQALYSYSNPTHVLASQVVAQVLEKYSNPTNVIVSQVVLQVLRSVAAAVVQDHTRHRTDNNPVDGTATWLAAEDATNVNPGTGVFRVRTSLGNAANYPIVGLVQLFVSKNGGAYVQVTDTSSNLQIVDIGIPDGTSINVPKLTAWDGST